MTASLMRQGSATTLLQADKLLASTNLVQEWRDAQGIDFDIHILAATDDPLSPPQRMMDTYTSIYNTNRQMTVILDIVNGRHGFTIMRPDYIAGILCRECKKVNPDDTYKATQTYGF